MYLPTGRQALRANSPNGANYYNSRILFIWKGKSRKRRPWRAYQMSFSPSSLLFWTPLSSYLIQKCSPLSLPSSLCLPVLFYSFFGIPIWLFVILSNFLSLVFIVCYNGIPSYFMCTDSSTSCAVPSPTAYARIFVYSFFIYRPSCSLTYCTATATGKIPPVDL